MKSTLPWAAGATVLVAVAVLALAFLFRPKPPADSHAMLAAQLDAQIATLASRLPIRVDARTTLVSVSRAGEIVTYRYAAQRKPGSDGQPPADDRSNLYTPPPGFERKVCADPDAFGTMMAGATLRYSYVDENGALFGQYDVDAHKCAAMPK